MTPHPIDKLTVRDPRTVQNLTIFPLHLPPSKGPAYLASTVALTNHGLEVREVSTGGAVPNLMVINPSDFCVLLLDGEELRGAKQNRIINTTLLLAPRSHTTIPVSCTEQGRWHYSSPTFSHSGTVMPVKARRRKTRSVTFQLAHSPEFKSDQSEVWSEVQELQEKVGSHSPTGAMADAYEKMRAELEAATDSIRAEEGQCGLIAMIDGKPAGMDLISREDVYRELHPQLIRSYAMEALVSTERHQHQSATQGKSAPGAANQPPDMLAAKAFLERCAAIKGQPFPSVALGTDWRFIEEPVVGSGLEVEETWIHMAYFLDEPDASTEGRRHMARMSRRSQYRRHRPDGDGPVIY